MIQRFTRDGSDALEAELEIICGTARDRLLKILPPRRIEAILLGGGYGRGEGGVLVTPEGEKPYNDLEFYVCLKGVPFLNERRFGGDLHRLAEHLSQEAGVEVEFKLISLDQLRRAPVSMFYYDLITGHHRLHGNDTSLSGCDHHRAAHRIPLHETTRLLMNRCSGLLFATERLQREPFGPEESDFVGRNLAKARLAFGDVVLAARGLYHWSCLERHRRLAKSSSATGPQLDTIIALHEHGVSFKLRPARLEKPAHEFKPELKFLSQLGCELWLWLENRRLGSSFKTAENYALSDINKCPETNPWRNRLINARAFGASRAFSGRYPRERLLNSLPLLLWAPATFTDAELRKRLCHQLRASTAADFAGLVRAYEQLWKQYN